MFTLTHEFDGRIVEKHQFDIQPFQPFFDRIENIIREQFIEEIDPERRDGERDLGKRSSLFRAGLVDGIEIPNAEQHIRFRTEIQNTGGRDRPGLAHDLGFLESQEIPQSPYKGIGRHARRPLITMNGEWPGIVIGDRIPHRGLIERDRERGPRKRAVEGGLESVRHRIRRIISVGNGYDVFLEQVRNGDAQTRIPARCREHVKHPWYFGRDQSRAGDVSERRGKLNSVRIRVRVPRRIAVPGVHENGLRKHLGRCFPRFFMIWTR